MRCVRYEENPSLVRCQSAVGLSPTFRRGLTAGNEAVVPCLHDESGVVEELGGGLREHIALEACQHGLAVLGALFDLVEFSELFVESLFIALFGHVGASEGEA